MGRDSSMFHREIFWVSPVVDLIFFLVVALGVIFLFSRLFKAHSGVSSADFSTGIPCGVRLPYRARPALSHRMFTAYVPAVAVGVNAMDWRA